MCLYRDFFYIYQDCCPSIHQHYTVYSYGLLIFLTYFLLVNFSMYFDLKYVFHTDLQTPVLSQSGKGVLSKVYWDGDKRGVLINWCRQCSFLVNFQLEWKDINKSNKRQTYAYDLGVLRKKCSPKWENFTLKQGENFKKNMPRRIFFQERFPFRVTEFPVEGAFSIGWWCYITPVSTI